MFSKKPLQQQTVADPPTLNTDKEVEILIKSIEESSKHCRETLIALLVASIYILITVFSYATTDKVKLPLLGLEVPDNLFLLLGPVLVLAPYVYLQICVSDLRGRLAIYEAAILNTVFVPQKNLLLFPSVVTMGLLSSFPHSQGLQPSNSSQSTRRFYLYVRGFTWLLVYGFVPLVLLTLWLRFIGQQQVASLIPGLALIVVIEAVAPESHRPRVLRIVLWFMRAVLIAVSVASVPLFRHSRVLAEIWIYALAMGHAWGKPALPAIASVIVATFAVRFAYKNMIELVKSLPNNWRAPLEDAALSIIKKLYPIMKSIFIKLMK